MIRGGQIGGFEAGSIGHLRQRLGAQWLGLALGGPSHPGPPGAP